MLYSYTLVSKFRHCFDSIPNRTVMPVLFILFIFFIIFYVLMKKMCRRYVDDVRNILPFCYCRFLVKFANSHIVIRRGIFTGDRDVPRCRIYERRHQEVQAIRRARTGRTHHTRCGQKQKPEVSHLSSQKENLGVIQSTFTSQASACCRHRHLHSHPCSAYSGTP